MKSLHTSALNRCQFRWGPITISINLILNDIILIFYGCSTNIVFFYLLPFSNAIRILFHPQVMQWKSSIHSKCFCFIMISFHFIQSPLFPLKYDDVRLYCQILTNLVLRRVSTKSAFAVTTTCRLHCRMWKPISQNIFFL